MVAFRKPVQENAVLSYPLAVQKDIDVAAESLKYAKKGRIHTGIGTSDFHIYHKLNSNPEAIIERGVEAVKYAKKYSPKIHFNVSYHVYLQMIPKF